MSKKLKLIIIIVSSAILLLGIGLTIYFVSSDDEATDSYQPIVINEAELVLCDSNYNSKDYCDDKGNEIKREWYDADGNLEWYNLFEYNDKFKRITKSEFYNAEGELKRYTLYAYDDDENRITKGYDADGNLTECYKSIYAFSEGDGDVYRYVECNPIVSDDLIDEDCFTNAPSVAEVRYEYDDDDNPIKAHYFNEGCIVSTELYEYDADGNWIKTERYDAEGDLYEYSLYEYDAEGNWIKTESYDDDGNLLD